MPRPLHASDSAVQVGACEPGRTLRARSAAWPPAPLLGLRPTEQGLRQALVPAHVLYRPLPSPPGKTRDPGRTQAA